MNTRPFLEKLFRIMQAMDSDTFRRLNEYIHSIYFRVPAASVDLFDYLAPLYPHFPTSKVSAKSISALGGNLSTYRKAARAGSELLQAIEFFLAFEDWQKQDMSVDFHLFNSLQQLSLSEQFDWEFKKSFDRITNDSEQNFETFFYRHTFTELAGSGFDALLNRTIRNDLTPTIKTLNEFYSLKLLRYMCEAISRKQVLGSVYDEKQMNFALKTIEPFANPKFPYPYLFVNVYRMLKAETYEEGKPYYDHIKNFIAAKTDKKLPVSCIESMRYAISWCLYLNGKGFDETANEYLWWTELKIKYDLLLENGKLFPITFRNVIVLAIDSNKTSEWMLLFIEQYASYLPKKHRDNNLAFAKGLYYYRKKSYLKANRNFLTAQAKDEVIFNAIIRRWQFMSTYELDHADTDLLLNQLTSFEKYMQRNKPSFQHVKGIFIPFIYYAEKVLKIGTTSQRKALRLNLDSENYFPGKTWLLEKLK